MKKPNVRHLVILAGLGSATIRAIINHYRHEDSDFTVEKRRYCQITAASQRRITKLINTDKMLSLYVSINNGGVSMAYSYRNVILTGGETISLPTEYQQVQS